MGVKALYDLFVIGPADHSAIWRIKTSLRIALC
jgi:hypothetical protein